MPPRELVRQLREVTPNSIRLRILKEVAGVGGLCVVWGYTELDPLEDTERLAG